MGFLNWKPGKYKRDEEVDKSKAQYDKWKNEALQNFEYGDFQTSDRTNNLQQQLDALKKPGDFTYDKQGNMDNLFEQILNRPKFQYNINEDALYNQYKDRYINQGKMAMMDTMGQAAAKTGGYGNTYAQMAGQQAYQEHLKGLNDKVPELYAMAMQAYQNEGDNMRQNLGLYRDDMALKYGQYRDNVADFNAMRDFLNRQYESSYGHDMGEYEANRGTAQAENESYNNNILNNRDFYGKDFWQNAEMDYGKWKDQQAFDKAAIDMQNDTEYRNQQMAAEKAKAEAANRDKLYKKQGYSNLDAVKAGIWGRNEYAKRGLHKEKPYGDYVLSVIDKYSKMKNEDGSPYLTDEEIEQLLDMYNL